MIIQDVGLQEERMETIETSETGSAEETGSGRRSAMMRPLEHRIPPPILALLVAAFMATAMLSPGQPSLPLPWRLTIALVFIVGAGRFGFPAFAAFGKAKTTIDPVRLDRASALVTTGIYWVTRNPMYVALTLLLCAWAAWLAQPLPCIGPVAFAIFIDRFQIVPEERAMTATFGSAYADYKASVRRWI